MTAKAAKTNRGRNLAILIGIVAAWLIADQAAKAYANTFAVGHTFAGPFLGIMDFTLVHNTGAAWGMFGGNPVALGLFSLLICVIAVLYLLVLAPDASVLSTVGLSLIVAGGIGNCIDRFCLQYVVDFIRPVFIDFPVFNIADIGVTCGVAIFVVSIVLEMAKPDASHPLDSFANPGKAA